MAAIILGCRSFVNFTNKANLPTSKTEMHARQKLCHFGRYVAKARLFCLKSSVRVTQAGVFIRGNFHPGYQDLGRINRDLGNRTSPASHTNTRVAGRDLGNRASLVYWAHMKRLYKTRENNISIWSRFFKGWITLSSR